jgi:hypothetical protein
MNTTQNEKTDFATFPCNGAWQPCYPQFQHENNFGQFRVFSSRFIVRTTVKYAGKIIGSTDHHGRWFDRKDAERFAASCSGRAEVEVIEVKEYWYCPAFGKVRA